MSLGALICLGVLAVEKKQKIFRLALMTHGVTLLLLLISGFGLLAKMNVDWPWPVWPYIKLGAWLCFGAAAPFFRLKKDLWTFSWAGTIVLGLIAVMFAHLKSY